MAMKKNNTSKSPQTRALMEELEPRLLFSADLPGVLAQTGLFGDEPHSTPPAIVALMDAPTVGATIGNQERIPDDAGIVLNQPRTGATPQKELVFVDAGAPNYQQLINDLLKAQAEGRPIEVVVLESGRDGVEQITEAIEERRDVGAVHIVSHGSDGSLTLGNSTLNAYNIERYRDAIKNWQASLTEGADLLLYGCDFAGSAQGREMVEVLSALTGADVAASTDKTGIADRGGDWELEYQVGDVETGIVLSADLQQSWDAILATTTFQQDVLSYTDTQDTSLLEETPGTPDGGASTVNVDLEVSGANSESQGLLRFDNIFGAGANQIPVGAIIDSAELTVWTDGDSNATISLHRMLANWSESSTWTSMVGGLDSGVDYAISTDGTYPSPGLDEFFTFTGLEATLQAWSDNPSSNYGWGFITDGNNGWDMASSEWGTVSQRPELSVTWHVEDVNLYYGDGTAGMPKTRQYDGGTETWSIESPTSATGDTVKWTVAEASPTSKEELVAVLTETGGAAVDLQMLRWDGSAWTTDWTDGVNTVSFADIDKRSFDVAYEQSSGNALVVYADDDTNPMYRTWDGSTWSGPTAVFGAAPGTGNVLWVELVSKPGSDEIALVYSDANMKAYSVIWDGTSWGTPQHLTSASDLPPQAIDFKAFDAAYEQTSGNLLVTWSRTDVGASNSNFGIEYATYDGATWTAHPYYALVTGRVAQLDLAAEPGGDRIALSGMDVDGNTRFGLDMWLGGGAAGSWAVGGLNEFETEAAGNHIEAAYSGGNTGTAWTGVGWVGTSGEAVAVYSDPTGDQGVINWAKWDGAAWAVQGDINIPGSATNLIRSVQIKSFESQNKLMAVFSDDQNDLYAATYDGTTWTVTEAGGALETALSDGYTVNFDFALPGNTAPIATVDTFNTAFETSIDTAASWWDASWSYRQELTIDNTDRPELTDFPVLIKLEDGVNIDYSLLQADGGDLRFFDDAAGTTALAYDIDSWNPGGTSYVWVKVSTVSAYATDSIWMYYGNATAPDGETSSAVWTNDYRAIWHLDEDPGGPAPQMLDSTANANDGTVENAPVQAPGQIGDSLLFDGTLDRNVDVADSASLQLSTDFTVSAWVNTTTTSADFQSRVVVAKWGAAAGDHNYWLGKIDSGGADTFSFFVDDVQRVDIDIAEINDGSWHHVVGVADSSAGLLRLYVDGVERATSAYDGSSVTGTSDLNIGRSPGVAGQDWDGGIDEVRIAGVARNTAWIEAEYAAGNGAAFVSFSGAQAYGVLVNDTDGDDDPLTVSAVQGSGANVGSATATDQSGSVTLNADGSFNYTPATGFSGADTFTYTVSDGVGGTDSVTVTINVAGNTAPTDLTATATVNGGLSINDDGGDDAFLVADDGGALLGGLGALSFEVQFNAPAIADGDFPTFISYSAPTNSDGIWFGAYKSGGTEEIGISLNGNWQAIAYDVDTLFDGTDHALAFTWDNTGAWAFYVDGVSVGSGGGLAIGETMEAGGTLVLGHDQDVGNEVYLFDPANAFNGTFYDIRFFDDVRTPGEIAANFDATVVPSEPNLIANWTLNDVSTTGAAPDAVGTNDLTIAHVSQGGFTASNPALTLSVVEAASNGTVVGSVTGTDADGSALSYSLTDDAGGRFAINSTTGQITVADGSLLDYETVTFHDITVRVTDSEGLTYDEVFRIDLIDVVDSADVNFTITSTASISEDAGATATFTLTLGGDALQGPNTASVDIIATGSATSGTDYDDFVTALTNTAGSTPGVTFDGTDTLTFDSTFNGGSGTGNFVFTVDAIDDLFVEGTETITATLSNPSVVTGTATVGNITNLNIATVLDSDNSEERIGTGVIDVASSDLEIGWEQPASSGTAQIVALRFQSVTIPVGATVTNAYIQFAVDEADNVATSVTFRGELDPNPATFSTDPSPTSDFDLSNRQASSGQTVASVAWNNIPEWTAAEASANTAGPNQASSDLSSIVQELIEQGGWASGNAMAFFIEGSGSRTAVSGSQDLALAPKLVVEYALGGDSTTTNITETDVASSGSVSITQSGGSTDVTEGGATDTLSVVRRTS
jgi:hypothetical protein